MMLKMLLTVVLVIVALPGPATANNEVCSSPKDREFDFWIGEWDIENRQSNPGNPTDPNLYSTGSAVARIFPVAGGCGIAELWDGELSWGHVRGFSLRSYDADADKWTLLLNWPAPNAGVSAGFTTLEGRFRHARGEFFNSFAGTDGTTVRNRFTFSDIGPASYRWDSALSTDDGVSWKTNWIMEGSRRGSADVKGPGRGPLIDEEAEACQKATGPNDLTFLEGDWSGSARSGAPVQLEVLTVMGGCAVLEYVSVGGDQPSEEFRVRAFRADDDHWVQYAVSNQQEGLRKRISKVVDGRLEWFAADATEAAESWQVDDDQVLHWARGGAEGKTLSAQFARTKQAPR